MCPRVYLLIPILSEHRRHFSFPKWVGVVLRVTVSRLLSHLAGEAQLFYFAFSRIFTVVGIFANSQQQLSLNFPLISHRYSQHRHHYQGAKGADSKANGSQREEGPICSVGFFLDNSKGSQEGKEGWRYMRFWQAGKENSLLFRFPIRYFFIRFEITRGKGGECHSLTAVDSEEDWTGGVKR